MPKISSLAPHHSATADPWRIVPSAESRGGLRAKLDGMPQAGTPVNSGAGLVDEPSRSSVVLAHQKRA
jgi:hypothetical protein